MDIMDMLKKSCLLECALLIHKNPISLVPQTLRKIHNQPDSNLELKLQKNPVTNLFVYVF